ncbi:MAG: hypothetical protein HQ490_09210 [Lutibacter sp.]|nr:hypothetical protein [Lutibacter sp.]
MKLKNKKYAIVFLAVGLIIFKSNAQDKRIKLEGFVKYDSIYLQDINILNKATNLGASSYKDGYFTMYVKEGDPIAFSSLVYENRSILI